MCPETEETLYTDQFFESQDIVVNALDNVEARRYMDRSESLNRLLYDSQFQKRSPLHLLPTDRQTAGNV